MSLTPDILRRAADHFLWDGTYHQEEGDTKQEFSCWAVLMAGQLFNRGDKEWGRLLYAMGACGGVSSVLPLAGHSSDVQAIRFMLLHFMANFLESEE